ncbi:MAG: hypothetical protein KDD70_00875 [Bdellovibrionales bacterium]|nr:hypothetical protein [Bdellovibrionales bacterium]
MADSKETSVQQDYALVLLVKEIMDQLDELHALRKQGLKAHISHELLREMCSVLPELDETLKERYFDILISTSSKAEVTREIQPSEEMVVASIAPKRRTIDVISQRLGVKAA